MNSKGMMYINGAHIGSSMYKLETIIKWCNRTKNELKSAHFKRGNSLYFFNIHSLIWQKSN